MSKRIKICVVSAMLAALTCIATMIIKVPTIGTNGYVNIGDTIVLISAWLIGFPYGAIAAGIGSGLADLLAGYPSYVPGTVVIKFGMAAVCVLVYNIITKVIKNKLIAHIVSGIAAEAVMVVGYFLYEATLLGYGIGAAASIPSNIVQGVTCLVLGVLLISALKKIGYLSTLLGNE